MPRLFWFHAYRRPTTAEVLEVLRQGPSVHPAFTATKQAELDLGLAGPSVYCYLGRTKESFGDNALAVRAIAEAGEVSPFDTGGLQYSIRPVCKWPNDAKTEFLQAYSWPTRDLNAVLSVYPGNELEQIRRYLDTEAKPGEEGPHAFWKRIEASIWASNHDWRAWTWEGRWPQRFSTLGALEAWTCSPARFPEVIEWAETASQDERRWFEDVALSKFISGGVGALVDYLKRAQVES